MQRKNFSFRYEWSDAIADLPSVIRLEIYEATVRYAETGSTGELSDRARQAFEKFILPDFLRREKAALYRARARARRKAAEEACETKLEPEPIETAAASAPAPNRRERRLMAAEERRRQKRMARRRANVNTALSRSPEYPPGAC